MLKIKVENGGKFVSRWLGVRFAALPARIEGRGIRLRHTLARGGNFKFSRCPICYRIEKTDGAGKKFRPMGFIGLYNLDLRQSAEIAVEIVEVERGKGTGGVILGLFLDQCLRHAIAEEMFARVRPDNEAALRLFKRKKFDSNGETPGPDGFLIFKLRLALPPDKAETETIKGE